MTEADRILWRRLLPWLAGLGLAFCVHAVLGALPLLAAGGLLAQTRLIWPALWWGVAYAGIRAMRAAWHARGAGPLGAGAASRMAVAVVLAILIWRMAGPAA